MFDGFLRGEAVDHVGVSDQDQVQPTAPPLSTRRHAELSASGLQQLPDLLQHRQPTPNELQTKGYKVHQKDQQVLSV